MSIPVDIIANAVHDIQSTRYAALASASIITFDHLLTLDSEVDLIWRSSWSKGKVLFIVNRYYAVASVIFNTYALFSPNLTDTVIVSSFHKTTLSGSELLNSCIRFLHWQCWTGLVTCIISQVILQMRIYALYSLNKKILALMVTSFLVTTIASATIIGTVVSKMMSSALSPIPGIVFCVGIGASRHFYAFWIPILAFETLLCGLALYRGFQTFVSSSPPFRSGQHLVSMLIRDSVLYFLVMFAAYFTNLLIWVLASKNLMEVPISFTVAFSCVLSNRIILNVREVNREMELSKLSESRSQYTGHLPVFTKDIERSRGIAIPGEYTLTEFEMAQLRSMRAEP